MSRKLLIAGAVLFFMNVAAQAHPGGHGGVIPEDEAGIIATKHVARLVDAGKLSKSWDRSKMKAVENRQSDGTNEYVVIFFNSNETNMEHTTLYVFLTEAGEYIAANFSGQ